ncbi:hypothetical protein Ahy_A03g011761 [Arachis hypogaea]|uniref:Retrotransposon Copia-like N-terminal domain-containing protein n=1 Tax=Arachis hypogaea TaxID=3818 RepID=A0A445DRP1_ARAHY|nr:hypothetical protein Ahy_A03g011761 [Arachis hypogaea]
MDSTHSDVSSTAASNVDINTLSQLLLQLTQLQNRTSSGTVHPPIDQNSPYFLHPAESPGNPLISLRLNSQNYTNWSRSISLGLESKNKIPFIDGSLPRPEVTDPMYAAWGRCNTYVLSWLHLSLSHDILQSVIWRKVASDLWNDLKKRYYQGDLYHVSELYEELYSAKQGDLSITSYFTKMQAIWEEIDNFRPIPMCLTCTSKCICGLEEMRRYRNEDYIARFLRGLNDQFATAKTQIMLLKPLPDMDSMFAMLTQQERQLSPSIDTPDSQILYAANSGYNFTRGRGRGRGGVNGRGRSSGRSHSTKHCSFCGRTGHIVDTCFKKHGLPPHLQKRGSINNTFTDENDEISALPSTAVKNVNPI